MDDALLATRRHFPTLEGCAYLISNSLGAMPAGAARDLEAYARSWTERGVRAWEESWWDLAREVGDGIALLLGALPDSVSMHPNVTLAEAVVLSSLDWAGPRNGLVTTELEFPSLRYLYEGLGRRLGARIVSVPSEDGVGIPTERLLEAIDETTRLVAVSHVFFRSAWIQDAEAIAARAREVGALVVLDAYQSVGTVPVDVEALGVDFLVGGVLKWLCGGPGGAFLYARPALAETLEPALTGWMAHPRPFDFAPAPMAFVRGSYRFANGTPNVPGLFAARAGPALVREAGVEAIRAKSRRQTARLVEAARAEGWTVRAPADPDRRAGTVAVDVPHGLAVKRELVRREVIVDYRPEAGIRIAPHFYTSDEECDRAVEEIRDILRTGAWRAHLGRPATVT
jgi:kynureninase